MRCADPFLAACAALRESGGGDGWLAALCDRAEAAWRDAPHGDLPRWRDALAALPRPRTAVGPDGPAPELGEPVSDPTALRETLMQLHPWRKGPWRLGGVAIDSEWRSDLKWARIEPHLRGADRSRLPLRGDRVLDIGSGNGYFGWRMLAAGAHSVVGVDPTWVFVMQWLACRHFAGSAPNYVLPLGIEDLPPGEPGFDTVCSMGVLYHRRDPLEHLGRLRTLLRPGGRLVLETLVLPDDRSHEILEPTGRYARMRNVWAIPGTDRLQAWVARAGFADARLVDVTPTTVAEQRSTPWMRFESLDKALAPADRKPKAGKKSGAGRTVEGHPAPIRAVVIARR